MKTLDEALQILKSPALEFGRESIEIVNLRDIAKSLADSSLAKDYMGYAAASASKTGMKAAKSGKQEFRLFLTMFALGILTSGIRVGQEMEKK